MRLSWSAALPVVLTTLFAGGGCSTVSTEQPPAPATSPAPAAVTDPRVSEMRVLVLELVDRMEVMQSRLNRMEDVLVQLAASDTTRETATRSEAAPAPRGAAADNRAAVQRYQSASDAADRYREALVMFGRGQNDQARTAFTEVYDADPVGELADNALFWIAETHFVMNDFSEAIRYYDRVVNEFPSQNKAPDAMHRKSLALVKLGDLSLAQRTLQSLIERYPYSTAASAARQEIERIRY